jgi:hypothetical protein
VTHDTTISPHSESSFFPYSSKALYRPLMTYSISVSQPPRRADFLVRPGTLLNLHPQVSAGKGKGCQGNGCQGNGLTLLG